MPEFIMPTRGRVAIEGAEHIMGATLGWENLDAFTQGYIEAMFFTDASSADDGDLENATFADIAPQFLASIIADCQRFQTEALALLETAYSEHDYDESQAGRDYWYTRNGHGVGFWDRGLGDLGDKLSDAAGHSTIDIYRGDDGQVYGS